MMEGVRPPLLAFLLQNQTDHVRTEFLNVGTELPFACGARNACTQAAVSELAKIEQSCSSTGFNANSIASVQSSFDDEDVCVEFPVSSQSHTAQMMQPSLQQLIQPIAISSVMAEFEADDVVKGSLSYLIGLMNV